MLVRKETIEDGCLLGVWEIVESCEQLFGMLSVDARDYASKYIATLKSIKRQREWLSTRVVLQILTNDNKKIKHASDGQPYLSDNSYHISISHSRKHVAVLLHQHKKVGVDIENHSNRVLNIESRFIADNEYIDPNNRRLHLTLHWCAKETLYKLMDSTNVIFKKHLYIHPFAVQDKGVIKATEFFSGENRDFRIFYEVNEHYLITWGMV